MQIENVMTRRNTPRVSFIGFGEAGQAIAAGLPKPMKETRGVLRRVMTFSICICA